MLLGNLDGESMARADVLKRKGPPQMRPQTAKIRFTERLEAAGLSLATLTPAAGIEVMLDYYAEERADGCILKWDGDMLLFEWGTYDWGNGPAFEVNITRQLIDTNDEETEPQQLSLTFRFDPAIAPAGLDAGNKWCKSPRTLPTFRRFLSRAEALLAVGQQCLGTVELRYGRV
jgi:hypothetical protein